MSLASIIEATRRAAALFDMPDRGVLEVLGDDRVRWLDGMISGDVARLAEGPSGGGCYATLLTNRGAIVADLHVGRLEDRFVLETAREWIPKTKETLERFIIADDVELRDLSSDLSVLGLEGPLAAEMLARACGAEISLAPDAWGECTIADRAVRIAAFGFTGERGFQLHASRDDAEAVRAALEVAGEAEGLVRGDAEALEVLRVEAGIPMLGRELDGWTPQQLRRRVGWVRPGANGRTDRAG